MYDHTCFASTQSLHMIVTMNIELEKYNCTPQARAYLSRAQSLAYERSSREGILPLHLFYVLLKESHGITMQVFTNLDVDIPSLKDTVEENINNVPTIDRPHAIQSLLPWGVSDLNIDMMKAPSPALFGILSDAYHRHQKAIGDPQLGVDHLLLALLQDNSIRASLRKVNPSLTVSTIERTISKIKSNYRSAKLVHET